MSDDIPKKFQDGTLIHTNIQGVDEDGFRKNIQTDSDGNLQIDSISNFLLQNTLLEILEQLKINNAYLSEIVGEELTKSDVED